MERIEARTWLETLDKRYIGPKKSEWSASERCRIEHEESVDMVAKLYAQAEKVEVTSPKRDAWDYEYSDMICVTISEDIRQRVLAELMAYVGTLYADRIDVLGSVGQLVIHVWWF